MPWTYVQQRSKWTTDLLSALTNAVQQAGQAVIGPSKSFLVEPGPVSGAAWVVSWLLLVAFCSWHLWQCQAQDCCPILSPIYLLVSPLAATGHASTPGTKELARDTSNITQVNLTILLFAQVPHCSWSIHWVYNEVPVNSPHIECAWVTSSCSKTVQRRSRDGWLDDEIVQEGHSTISISGFKSQSTLTLQSWLSRWQ